VVENLVVLTTISNNKTILLRSMSDSNSERSVRYYYRIVEKVWRYHLELSVFLRANQDLWNEFIVDEMLKARPPAVSPEAPPVANDDEVEEGGTLSYKWF
jgi:hypothetical protein